MSHTLVEEKVNIDICPQVDNQHLAHNGQQIAIGDLHANAVKLMYFLVRHGVLELSADQYEEIVKIYKKDIKALNRIDINSFNEIINNARINPNARNGKLLLIGDELADRGQNDYFILKLFGKLQDSGVSFNILLSNHGAEFIQPYEARQELYSRLEGQANSMHNLQILLDKKIVDREEISTIVEKAYKPNLTAIEYTLNKAQDSITIYSHAAIGLNNIKFIAQALGVPYNGQNPVTLAKTIDAINEKFAEKVNTNSLSALMKINEVPDEAINGEKPIDQENYPFAHLIWNRDARNLERPDWATFVHGHDKNDLTKGNIYNLDNDLGKALAVHQYNAQYPKSTYTALVSNETKLKDKLVNDVFEIKTPNIADRGKIVVDHLDELAKALEQPNSILGALIDDYKPINWNNLVDARSGERVSNRPLDQSAVFQDEAEYKEGITNNIIDEFELVNDDNLPSQTYTPTYGESAKNAAYNAFEGSKNVANSIYNNIPSVWNLFSK